MDVGSRVRALGLVATLMLVSSAAQAAVTQGGDNAGSGHQSSDAESGTGQAGNQVVGSGAGTTIRAINVAEEPFSHTGSAHTGNLAIVEAGPLAVGSSIVQIGDNEARVHQSADANSGDAMAGVQVLGVVSATDVDVDVSNESIDAWARSGSAHADNAARIDVGPVATGDASIVQTGDNDANLNQSADARSGDAIAGSQIGGVSGGGGAVIVMSNRSTDAHARSGSARADNSATVRTGPSASGTG